MVASAILKNRKLSISQQRFDRSPQIWYIDAVWLFYSLNFRNFKNPRWRRSPVWKK